MQRKPRQKDGKHLDFIRSLPCIICGDNVTVEAAHIRMEDLSVAKPPTGMQTKPHDKYTLPLCGKHHREQHKEGELQFWRDVSLDPVKLALALYAANGDYEEGSRIVGVNGLAPWLDSA